MLGKTSRQDEITMEMVKQVYGGYGIRKILDLAGIPNEWNILIITLMFCTRDKKGCVNYRGITLKIYLPQWC